MSAMKPCRPQCSLSGPAPPAGGALLWSQGLASPIPPPSTTFLQGRSHPSWAAPSPSQTYSAWPWSSATGLWNRSLHCRVIHWEATVRQYTFKYKISLFLEKFHYNRQLSLTFNNLIMNYQLSHRQTQTDTHIRFWVCVCV